MRLWRLIGIGAVLMTAAACAQPPAGQAGRDLAGRTWVLTHIQGQAVEPRKSRPYTLVFDAQAQRLNAYGGCNQMWAQYVVHGQTLQVKDVASTLMACPDMQTEAALAQALAQVRQYRWHGRLLQLQNAQGQTVLQAQ